MSTNNSTPVLEDLLAPDIHSTDDLHRMGWSPPQIHEYVLSRRQKWNVARRIVRNHFAYLGNVYIEKVYDVANRTMRVTIYDDESINMSALHSDPIYALIYCVQSLDAATSDVCLESLLAGLSI